MPVELGTDMAREDGELRFGVALTAAGLRPGGDTPVTAIARMDAGPCPQSSDRAAGDFRELGLQISVASHLRVLLDGNRSKDLAKT